MAKPNLSQKSGKSDLMEISQFRSQNCVTMTAELEVAQNLNSHLASTNDLAMREIIISLINYDLKGKKVQPMLSMDIHKVSAVIVKNKFDEFAEDSGGRHDKDT